MVRVKLDAMRKWFIWIVILTGLDQASKRAAEYFLHYATPVEIFPSFNLMLTYNRGAAFSFLSDAGGWQRWFFVAVATAICAYILRWLSQLKPVQNRTALGLVMILSGGLGNLIDRALFAKVTDFLDVYYPSQTECLPLFYQWAGSSCHWPTFNIADIFICIGAGLLFIQILRENPNS